MLSTHQQTELENLVRNLDMDIKTYLLCGSFDFDSLISDNKNEIARRIRRIGQEFQSVTKNILDHYCRSSDKPVQAYAGFWETKYGEPVYINSMYIDEYRPGKIFSLMTLTDEEIRNRTGKDSKGINGYNIRKAFADSYAEHLVRGTVYEQWLYKPADSYACGDYSNSDTYHVYKVMIRMENGYVVAAYNDRIVDAVLTRDSISNDADYYIDEVSREKIHIDNMLSLSDLSALEMPTFINLYVKDRAYGGPEEGGWYYDTIEFMPAIEDWTKTWHDDTGNSELREVNTPPVKMHFESEQIPAAYYALSSSGGLYSKINSEQYFDTIKGELDKLNEGRKPISSVASEGVYIVALEEFRGTEQRSRKPRYS